MTIIEWLLIPSVFIVLHITYYFGFIYGKKIIPDLKEGHSSRVSNLQTGLMGVLGVMLAFSFSLSSTRFEQRRLLIIEEAMDIGTAYYRAGLLPDTIKSDLRNLLRHYLDERINYYKPGNTLEMMEQIQEKSENLQVKIWAETAKIGKNSPNLNTNLNILGLNTMIDITANVSSSFQTHVPNFILLLLIFITNCTVLILGYIHGVSDDRNFPFIFILNLVFCSILWLIEDLDTPTIGFLQADIYSLIKLKKEILFYNK